MKFYYVKRLYFRKVSEIKKFRTKIPDLGTFLYGIYCFEVIYTKLTFWLLCNQDYTITIGVRYSLTISVWFFKARFPR